MALRQTGTTGRHRKTSQAPGWTVPRQSRTSHAAASRPTARHRKTSPAAARRTTPRHRKQGNGQAAFSRFVIGQGNSIWTATRRAALPSALALGVLTVGGVITGGFGIPSLEASRADVNDPGNISRGSTPPSPTLTAKATPSGGVGLTLPPMADRGVRAPIEASGPALPITDQAATDVGNGDVGAGEPAQGGTTTEVRDRVTESPAFAPSVTAKPSVGHGGGGGGGGSAESTEPPAAPVLPGLFDGPSDDGPRGEVRSPRGRGDGPGGAQNTNDRRGGDGPGGGGSDGHNGGGGQHRRGGSHR
jgi:hypothetical protein